MEAKAIDTGSRINVGKHTDLALNEKDELVRDIKQKYSAIVRNNTALVKRVNPEDLIKMLDKWAGDARFNLANVADALNISTHGLELLLSMDGVKEYYASCRKRRGETFAATGFEVVKTPYEKVMNGEDVSPFLNNAAKNFSNYCLAMAKAFNSDYSPEKREGTGGNGVNVVVNTGIQLNV